MKPTKTATNSSGYVAEAILDTINADETSSYIVIADDDCYKYYAESIIAFTFLLLMINKDMHHMLVDPIKKEDPVKIYRAIQEHFKGGKNYHVESARKKLNAHRLGPDIERDLSKQLELISDLDGDARISEIWDFCECSCSTRTESTFAMWLASHHTTRKISNLR